MQPTPGVDVRLIEGGRGVFEIRIDGEVVFSKSLAGHFPSDAEIDALLEG